MQQLEPSVDCRLHHSPHRKIPGVEDAIWQAEKQLGMAEHMMPANNAKEGFRLEGCFCHCSQKGPQPMCDSFNVGVHRQRVQKGIRVVP